ncbi:putative PhzF superfamily epimerase YddE/YHI9 [Catenuloplanes nepalensis]|uniref:PhzF superfamily epimerase YddE/YHI9 n=1 Tax=Catenuloplanes nepalensis TaxID=587533 RepID=A0ABT9MT04_9ACTN|nr:putative PhzF superfamily epimerase YddE/YHI9 [Catenuloplanes nepalensis]
MRGGAAAALGLGAWLVAAGLLPGDGDSAYVVRRGAELGRPSVLECTVSASGGVPVGTTVAGHVVPVATGEIIALPAGH